MRAYHSALAASARRCRGSLMLVVLVALVLMVLMGTAYLQMARLDRVSTAQLATNNIDAVARATIAYIGEVLRDDVVTVGGEFFPPDLIEPYDYPWTNSGSSFNVELIQRDGTSNVQPAAGSVNDDTWLASSTPDFATDPDQPRWPKISNLMGIFLRLPADGGPPWPYQDADFNDKGEFEVLNPGATDPPGYINLSGRRYLFTDTTEPGTALIITGTGDERSMDQFSDDGRWAPWGADADGDGIADSRWTWAPIRQLNGISYVMAVRIVDNSSMINLNAATAMTEDGDVAFWPPGANMPRGYFPTSVDLSRLLSRVDGATSDWADELATAPANNSLFAYRGIYTAGVATPFGLAAFPNTYPAAGSYSADGRIGAWLDTVSLYGYLPRSLRIREELELRHRNGLNDARFASDLETRMPNVLRAANNTESQWWRLYGINDTFATPANMARFFQGGPSTDLIADREFQDVRKWLTTRSGAAIFAPNYPAFAGDPNGIHGGNRTLKYDLLYEDGGLATPIVPDRIDNMADRIEAVFTIGTPQYLNETNPVLLRQMAVEFALNIQDYADNDSEPSSATIGATTYYGLELMPFLREVYIQAGYEDSDIIDADGNLPEDGAPPYLGPDGVFDTWVIRSGSQAMAVEIGNPFDRPLTASLLNGRIQVAVMQSGSDVATYTLTGITASLGSRDRLIVYSNPTAPVDEGGYGSDIVADLALGSEPTHDAAGGTLTFSADAEITIELRVDVGSGVFVTYDRLTHSGFELPGRVTHNAGLTTQNAERHGQGSIARDGRNIRYLSNTGRDFVLNSMRLPASPNDPDAYRTHADGVDGNEVEELGKDSKGITGDTDLDFMQIPIANRPIFNVTELGWILMFGFSDASDGDLPQRLDSLLDERRFLSGGAVVPDATGIPHASMLMEQFTTLSPANDGIDNDNADRDENITTGADSPAEQFVPGLININTAPLHILTLAAPMPETINDVEALMRQVVDYRDNPGNRDGVLSPATGLRQERGIASIGELLLINPALAGSGMATTDNRDMIRYSFDAQPTTHDLYPMPEETATAYSGPFPHEGGMARFQFLSQTFTTRSDIFTAYVYIRGYRAGDWPGGPVESKRFLVVFDRSRITGPNDRVRVLGVSYE